MKRSFVFVLAIAFLGACSTKEIDFLTPAQDDIEFYASFEQPSDNDTKVYANEDLLLRWTADDRVSIFNKITYNQQYKFTGETGDNAGGFKKVDSDEFVTGNTIPHVVSIYPYQETTKITESEVLTVTLPAEQSYAEHTFGLGANTMVSVSSDNVLQYKNVGGYLRLSLYGYNVSVSSITLKGNNGEKLAGKASIIMPLDGVPTAELANDATNEITIICESPITLKPTVEESIDFWFVVPAMTFSKGFTISINETSGGVYEKSTFKSITIERSKLSKMSPIKVEQKVIPNNVIYYTSIDDKVVAPNDESVFGASIVSNEYIDGQGIITFDRDVTSIGNSAFRLCSNLSSITIPESVKKIGQEAFYSCSNLASINIPDNVTAIENNTFTSCSSLSSITIPKNVTKIGNSAFSHTSIRSLMIPQKLTSIGSFAFSSCEKIESITVDSGNPKFNSDGNCNAIIETDSKVLVLGCKNTTIPDYVTSIGYGSFCGCADLSSITIPNSVTTINDEAFDGCVSLSSIIIPNSVTSLGKWAFNNCSGLKSVIIPESITSIGYMCFTMCSGLGEVRCMRETPPAGGQYMFDYTYCPIYVPEGSVEAYQSKTYWRDYKSRIQAFPSSIVHVTSITFDRTSLSIPVGRSKTLNVTILPEDATNKTITWASSNPDVATVYLGKVTAVQTGSCTITATAYDGGLTATCEVTVVPTSDPSFYSSTDFSKDGEVVLLHEATVGNGVNLILLGDGFVDTDMTEGGLYDQRMSDAMDRLFMYEPYKSLKSRFNLYYVRAVSTNSVYSSEQSDRKFSYDEDGSLYFRSSVCYQYAKKVPNPTNQPLKVAVLFNINYMLARSFCTMELQSGRALAFILDVDKDVFCHELGGHGVAFLADEYEEYSGSFTEQSTLDQQYQYYGFGANVDWRNDVSSVKWSRFITDNRYSRENIGLYEGAYLYPRGIYRPTYNSMMRNQFLSTGKAFNAPSREQIYKTVMKYSEGSSWSYDYEEFVAIDEAGRNQASSVFNSANYAPSKTKQKEERSISDTHMPPVILDRPVKEICVDQKGKVTLIQ